MTAVMEAMMTTVWEFMLTAVLFGGDASVVLGGGKHPAAVDRIVTVTDRLYRHKLYSTFAHIYHLGPCEAIYQIMFVFLGLNILLKLRKKIKSFT